MNNRRMRFVKASFRRPSQSAAQQEAIVASFEVHVSYQLDLAPQPLAAVTCSAG
jgi:hypothetical protein